MAEDASSVERTTVERRKDKAWLLWDLRERRREVLASIPRKFGIMQEAAWHGADRLERLIALVKEIEA